MQLLTISSKTLSAGCSVGDIVGVFPDAHEFSATEYDIFAVIHTELTEEEINAFRPVYTKEEIEAEPRIERPRFELHYDSGVITSNKVI